MEEEAHDGSLAGGAHGTGSNSGKLSPHDCPLCLLTPWIYLTLSIHSLDLSHSVCSLPGSISLSAHSLDLSHSPLTLWIYLTLCSLPGSISLSAHSLDLSHSVL